MYKLLIVEDEEILRNGLITTIDWTKLGFQIVGCGKDGQEGLQKAKQLEADVVLTDIRMPKMNGLDMARQIKQFRNNIEIVFLSGYDEFSYAKQGLDIGVFNYIMKLNMYEEIEKVFTKLKKHLDITMHNISEIAELNDIKYKQKIIDLLDGKSAGWLEGMDKISLIVGCLSDKNVYSDSFEIMKDYIYVYLTEGNKYIGVCAASKTDDVMFGAKIMNVARTLSPYTVNRYIAISDIVSDAEDIPYQLKRAYKLLDIAEKKQGRLPNILLCRKDFAEHTTKIDEISFAEIEEQLELKRYTYYSNLSNQWFEDAVTAEGVYYPDARKIAERLALKLQDSLEEVNSDYVSEIDKFVVEANEKYSIIRIHEDFMKMIKPALISLQKINFNQAGAAIEEAVKYINKNYDKQISTKEIADMINLSTPYFSASFKKITGENYSNYLCNIRMEKACELLKTTKLKVYEISHMVGYLDEKHFSKMFSKKYNMTPATYRKTSKNS
ncbi:MAG: response regulator [Eubacteriales bacterium]